jgi:hypothetical protein
MVARVKVKIVVLLRREIRKMWRKTLQFERMEVRAKILKMIRIGSKSTSRPVKEI